VFPSKRPFQQFSTIHGLHDFFDARSFELKLVFGFILTLCVLLLLYCWSSVLLTYLEHNYVISLYVKEVSDGRYPEMFA